MSTSLKQKQRPSPLVDDRRFPDHQDSYEFVLSEVTAERLIRKRKHPAPNINSVDPNFDEEFDHSVHGKELSESLSISHLTLDQQSSLTSLIQKYWRIFSKKGVTIPVKDYECEIDTGNARPIVCKNIKFSPLELLLIKAAITKILELGHIRQLFEGAWLYKPSLAPKPHQENVTDITNCVWCFCVSYIGLNSVTKVISVPIPCCNEAVGNSFGGSL